jgi:hypothetical protein
VVVALFMGLLSGVEFTNFLVEGFTFVPVWVGGLFSEWKAWVGAVWGYVVWGKCQVRLAQRWFWKYKFPIVGVYVIVCLALGLYWRLGILGVMLVIFGVRRWAQSIPFVKKQVEDYTAANKVMCWHWEHDYDLVWLRRFIVFCYVAAVGHVVWLVGYLNGGVSLPLCGESVVTAAWWVHYLLTTPCYLYLMGLFLTGGANFHIVLYRNPVVPNGAKVAVIKALGQVGTGGLVLLGFVDATSRTPLIEPTRVGNWYQIHSPNGRGWGYDTRMTHQRVDVLINYSKFKPEWCINPKTGNMDKAFVSSYIDHNLKGLHDELPVSMLVQGHLPLPKGMELVKSVYSGGGTKREVG